MTMHFFADYRAFDLARTAQKQSGANDYNVLGALLKSNDEVRLHSRFLYSLLNPKGKHYQGSIFAELFLSIVGYPDWLQWKTLQVGKEVNFIDIHLTDGKRHVVVENKLNAVDQPAQLERYIESVQENGEVDPDDILVIYLSKGRMKPTTTSLGHLKLVTDALEKKSYLVDVNGNRAARYQNCHYRRDILAWIDACLDKVKEIPNLAFALREYRQIVEVATKIYESKVMDLETFLTDPADKDRIRYACEIAQQLPAIKARWLIRVLNQDMDELLSRQLDAGQLVPVSTNYGEPLHAFHFAPEHAKAFFGAEQGRENRNKGRFWRVASGQYKNRFALAVFFGRKMLHIGVLPIQTNSEGTVTLIDLHSDHAVDFTFRDPGFKKHDAIGKVLTGLMSWAEPLGDDIESLAHFKSSQHAERINRLIGTLLPG